jgi:hypothetical protein
VWVGDGGFGLCLGVGFGWLGRVMKRSWKVVKFGERVQKGKRREWVVFD